MKSALLASAALLSVLSGCSKEGAPALSRATPEPASSGVQPSRRTATTPVALDGTYTAAATPVAGTGPRVHARALRAWVYRTPNRSSERLGYLRAGSSSPTDAKPAGHDGCKGGWYPVEPAGFVCVGATATLSGDDPIVQATRDYPPDASRKLPYIYGTVRRPGPIYDRPPAGDELAKTEPDLAERMEKWLDAEGEIGASYAQQVWLGGSGQPPDARAVWQERRSDELPALFRHGGRAPAFSRDSADDDLVVDRMKPRVGFSFLRTFLHEGRRYGLTSHLNLVPTDRLRPIQGSDFRGVEIGKDIDFPFAFVRRPNARFVRYDKREGLREVGPAAYRAAIRLTGKKNFFKERLHYETVDGTWLSDQDASRLDPARRMPGWGKNGEKWIDINLTKQTLVLYAGEKPVYATLISSGEAGLEDHENSTATKRGIFRVHTKHVSATMSSDEVGEEFELRDVPYVQYFDQGGYALHGAYWHDRFGTPKSHGCINLSPEDARRIFYWTEPAMPPGWHGVLSPLKGTVLFVHP